MVKFDDEFDFFFFVIVMMNVMILRVFELMISMDIDIIVKYLFFWCDVIVLFVGDILFEFYKLLIGSVD